MRKLNLVTGGAGFIGAALIARLMKEASAEVICLDNLTSGRRAAFEPFLSDPRFSFIEADVSAPDTLQLLGGSLGLTRRIDRIWHLACPASPVHYQRDPLTTLRTAVCGTSQMLDLAALHGARMLQASTSEIYGDPEIHPQPETLAGRASVQGPRACYSEGKRTAEVLCNEHSRMKGTDVRVTRIFNTYGPGMARNDGRVIPTLIGQALSGQALTLFGDGRATRSYCYVDDLIDGLIAVMERPEWDGLPINLGRPVETSLTELAGKINTLCGTGAVNAGNGILHLAPLSGDPQRRCPDITRARSLLNWEPKITLDAGLALCIEAFRNPAEAERNRP